MNSDNVFNILRGVGKTTKKIEKADILRTYNHKVLKGVLVYAYDPFTKYYMSSKKLKGIIGRGIGMFDSRTERLLNVLHHRTLSGNKAKSVVIRYISSLTPSSAELFKRILDKDLRCGINVSTINSVFPGLIPEHKIMLAEEFNIDGVPLPCYASFKYDGVRATYMGGRLLSRAGNEFVGFQHILRNVPQGYDELDGELYVHGVNFDTISGTVRSHSISKLGISYYVFDIPNHTGTYEERMSKLGFISDNPFVKMAGSIYCKTIEDVMSVYEHALRLGFEGLVLKTPHHVYQNKRSKDWMKFKPENSEDFTVLDVFEGEGKYIGMLGGVIIMRNGVVTRVGSGFSDEQRRAFWRDKQLIIGRLIEVVYFGLTPKGCLRHPRFKTIRFDLGA